MTEEQWLAFWRRKACDLLTPFIIIVGSEEVKIECDDEDVAWWKFTYFGEYK